MADERGMTAGEHQSHAERLLRQAEANQVDPSDAGRVLTVFFDDEGSQTTAQAYYGNLVEIARQRQQALPWWSAARRRWRQHERRYRALAERAGR